MSKVRRASIHNLTVDSPLSARTRKSISKSRRSSLVEDIKPPSRRGSLAAVINALTSQTIEEPIVDLHDVYKKKVSKSFNKLNYFFGEPTPVDVCICEIRKEGLKAILESKVPLVYFLYYLLDEYSSENLFFFLKVEQFENYRKAAYIEEQREMAQYIYDTFISNNSNLQINLDDKVKRNITNQLTADFDAYSIFQAAKTSVYTLLETSYVRFMETQVYQEMVDHCGELTIHYTESVTRIAIEYLYKHLKQQKESVKSKGSRTLEPDLVDHYGLIKGVIETFVKDMFGKSYLPSKKMF